MASVQTEPVSESQFQLPQWSVRRPAQHQYPSARQYVAVSGAALPGILAVVLVPAHRRTFMKLVLPSYSVLSSTRHCIRKQMATIVAFVAIVSGETKLLPDQQYLTEALSSNGIPPLGLTIVMGRVAALGPWAFVHGELASPLGSSSIRLYPSGMHSIEAVGPVPSDPIVSASGRVHRTNFGGEACLQVEVESQGGLSYFAYAVLSPHMLSVKLIHFTSLPLHAFDEYYVSDIYIANTISFSGSLQAILPSTDGSSLVMKVLPHILSFPDHHGWRPLYPVFTANAPQVPSAGQAPDNDSGVGDEDDDAEGEGDKSEDGEDHDGEDHDGEGDDDDSGDQDDQALNLDEVYSSIESDGRDESDIDRDQLHRSASPEFPVFKSLHSSPVRALALRSLTIGVRAAVTGKSANQDYRNKWEEDEVDDGADGDDEDDGDEDGDEDEDDEDDEDKVELLI
ncbi:hypothetical protein FRB99_004743 [Tulasnella sp. 403]|nr:hypothetical protein FRB99_004743 [Tulasnella sp. 403]